MKKRSAMLLILIAVLAAVIILYAIISNISKENNTPVITIDTSPIILAEDNPADIISLSYTYGGETYEFEFSTVAYKWYYKPDNNFPLDQTYLQYMASAISSMAANRLLEETRDNFAQYGLDKPYMTLKAVFKPEKKDEYTRIYNIGDLNTFNDNYYFNVGGTDTVYTIVSGLTAFFEYKLLDLAIVDKIPSFTSNVYSIKEIIINDISVTDAETLKTLAGKCAVLQLGKPVAYIGVSPTSNEYGFNEGSSAIIINYTEEVKVQNEEDTISSSVHKNVTLRLTFGKENNGITYCMANGNGLVYEVDAKSVLNILGE